MEKRCTRCDLFHPVENFRWKNKTLGQRISLCTECDKMYRAERYRKHRDRIRAVNAKAEKKRREQVALKAVEEPDYRRCIDCCQLKPKEEFRWANRKTLRRIVRCRSCDKAHRVDYYDGNKNQFLENNRRVYAKLRNLLNELKTGQPCADCGGIFPPCAMDFDHREPSQKIAKVSAMVYKGSRRLLLEEVAKCDLVCAVCHRIRTHAMQINSNSGSEKDPIQGEKHDS